MSLDWSIEKVTDWESLTHGDTEPVITSAIVWHMLRISMSDITPSNWTEVYARISVAEKLEGPSLSVPAYESVPADELKIDDLVSIAEKLYYVDAIHEDGHVSLSAYVEPAHPFAKPTRGDANSAKLDRFDRHSGFESRAVTPHDVQRRIGLSTNVSTVSRAKWAAHIMNTVLDARIRHADRAVARKSVK